MSETAAALRYRRGRKYRDRTGACYRGAQVEQAQLRSPQNQSRSQLKRAAPNGYDRSRDLHMAIASESDPLEAQVAAEGLGHFVHHVYRGDGAGATRDPIDHARRSILNKSRGESALNLRRGIASAYQPIERSERCDDQRNCDNGSREPRQW